MMKSTMRAAVGIAIPAFQLTAIGYARFTDARYFRRAPYDARNRYGVNGREEQVWTRPPR